MATKTIEVSDLNVAIEQRVQELDLADNNAAAARKIGVSRQVYEGWLKGRMPRLVGPGNAQRKIAVFLGVTPLKVIQLAGVDTSDDDPSPAGVGSAEATRVYRIGNVRNLPQPDLTPETAALAAA